MDVEELLAAQDRYYQRTLEEHGATPKGVDWNSPEAQEGRFAQLLKVCEQPGRFSLIDYGCGYGALADYMVESGYDVDYTGFDVSERMLDQARAQHADSERCTFVGHEDALEPADYVVASGVFNLKLEAPDEAWRDYVVEVIERLADLGRSGFAFNMLTSYSDADKMRPHLYYGDPCFFFDLCKGRFSRNVALLHDYEFYEFTVIVRK